MWVILHLITDTNCNWASPPNPLPPQGRGTSHLFLLIFRKYLKQETGEKKVTSAPPSPQGEGIRGGGPIAVCRTLGATRPNLGATRPRGC